MQSRRLYVEAHISFGFVVCSQIATGTRNTLTIRNNAKLLEVTDNTEDGSTDAPSATPAETAEASSAAAATARAAKKRRVGGVNIFPGMRKVRRDTTKPLSFQFVSGVCMNAFITVSSTMIENSIP